MRVYLLVEGVSDLVFIQRLLPSDIQREITIVPVGGRSNISSMARSLLVTKRRPLALVADADTSETEAVEQRFQTLEELVHSASAGVPFKVILAVPEIESWFFAIPEALERLSGKRLSSDQRALGELRPKEVLRQLFKGADPLSVDNLVDELTESEVETLRKTSPRRDLIDFLKEHVNKKPEPQPV